MARTPSRLAGPARFTASAATIYDPPAAGAIIRHILVSNPTGGTNRTFTLSVGTDGVTTRLWSGFPVNAGEVFERHVYIPLADADIVQGLASATNELVYVLSGDTL